MNKEERLRSQAEHYIACFMNECPLHDITMVNTEWLQALTRFIQE